jgi:hypothetical protein
VSDFPRNMFRVFPFLLRLIAVAAAGAPAVAFDQSKPDTAAIIRPPLAGTYSSAAVRPTDGLVCFSRNKLLAPEGDDFSFQAKAFTAGRFRCLHRISTWNRTV